MYASVCYGRAEGTVLPPLSLSQIETVLPKGYSMTGYVLWEGPSAWDGQPIALIATMHSSNRKTGDMVQTWILKQDENPVAAVMSGTDDTICGACPMRGFISDDRLRERKCYVNYGQAPNSIWRKYQAGGYATLASPAKAARFLAGESVRLGAYGDPAMVPFDVIESIMRDVTNWTGYTHQWRDCDPRWSQFLMASCESDDDVAAATQAGWRTFTVVPAGSSGPARSVVCAADRERNPLQCIDCGMCAGTRRGTTPRAVNVYIEAHGTGAKYVTV